MNSPISAYLGIDTGGTEIKWRVVTETGDELCAGKELTVKGSPEAHVDQIVKLVKHVRDDVLPAKGDYQLAAVGEACPGIFVNTPKGPAINLCYFMGITSKLLGNKVVNLAERYSMQLGDNNLKFYVQNDVGVQAASHLRKYGLETLKGARVLTLAIGTGAGGSCDYVDPNGKDLRNITSEVSIFRVNYKSQDVAQRLKEIGFDPAFFSKKNERLAQWQSHMEATADFAEGRHKKIPAMAAQIARDQSVVIDNDAVANPYVDIQQHIRHEKSPVREFNFGHGVNPVGGEYIRMQDFLSGEAFERHFGIRAENAEPFNDQQKAYLRAAGVLTAKLVKDMREHSASYVRQFDDNDLFSFRASNVLFSGSFGNGEAGKIVQTEMDNTLKSWGINDVKVEQARIDTRGAACSYAIGNYQREMTQIRST